MKRNDVKKERINAEVQRALSQILREEVKDPRLPLMLSVTRCIVAPDLKTCKAYISMMGDEQAKADCRAALKSASGFIRRELAHSLNLRLTPEISYILDESIDYGVLEKESNKLQNLLDAWNGAEDEYRNISKAYQAATIGHLAVSLREGQPADDGICEAIRAAHRRTAAVRDAAALLSRSRKSRSALLNRLKQRGHPPEAAEYAVSFLEKKGILNDAEACADYARTAVRTKRCGKR